MNQRVCETRKLGKGVINLYDFGAIRLHAYQTNDFIDNEVFLLEKNGSVVILESPCFFDNIRELTEYLSGMRVEAKLIAYHGAGASFLPEVPNYATKNTVEYSASGGGKALIDSFAATFGASFDSSVHEVTQVIGEGELRLGGIDFVIKQTADAFDVEIPEINAVYTHMLGHDCHSIVAGAGHADAIIAELRGYIAKGYAMILSSHYTPERLKDAETKIAYLEDLKRIAVGCADAESFQAKVRSRYPTYSGGNYLDLTAGFFFPRGGSSRM